MHCFGRRISGKCHAERIQRFVVAAHAGFAPHQFERSDRQQTHRDASSGTEEKQLERQARRFDTEKIAVAQHSHGHENDRQQDDIVQAAFQTQRQAHGFRKTRSFQQTAQHHRIGRCKSSADHHRRRGRKIQKHPCRNRDERRRQQSARPDYKKS